MDLAGQPFFFELLNLSFWFLCYFSNLMGLVLFLEIRSSEIKENEIEATDKTEAEWLRMDKPAKGWLVPITNGYKAISPVYPSDEVVNTRDSTTPICFVEAVHSIGEWRSLHRIQQVSDMLWHYHQEQDWYLCQQSEQAQPELAADESEDTADDDFNDDFLNSLN